MLMVKDLEPDVFYIDSREKDTDTWPIISAAKEFFENLGFKVIVAELEIGDFIYNNVVFERKLISDFVSSVQNKHLQNQAYRMKDFPYRFVLLEGDKYSYIYDEHNYGKRQFSENHFNGAIAELTAIYNLNIPPCFETHTELFDFMYRVIKRLDPNRKPIDINWLFTKKRDIYSEYVLTGTKGISKIKAQQILTHYTVDEVRNGDAKKIAKDIKGVGEKTILNIQKDLDKLGTYKFCEDMI